MAFEVVRGILAFSPPCILHQAKTTSDFTKGHATTARIMTKPCALPQSGLSSSGLLELRLAAAALHLSHHCHHYCYCSADAAGGGGDSLVGAVGLLLLLLGRPRQGRQAAVEGRWWWEQCWWPWCACQLSLPPGRAVQGSGAARCSPFHGLSSRPYHVHSVLRSSGGAGGRRQSEPSGAPR